MERLAGLYGGIASLVGSGWGARTRHLVTGILVALPISCLVLLLVALTPLGVGIGTVVMAVFQLTLSLAIAGWQRKGGFRS